MGLFSDERDKFDNTHHGSITHDVLGGAVAFEAAKAWEDHCAANGKPDNHALAKEVLAGLVGAGLTRLVETKGLDAWDAHQRAQAEKHARERLNETIIVNEYRQ